MLELAESMEEMIFNSPSGVYEPTEEQEDD